MKINKLHVVGIIVLFAAVVVAVKYFLIHTNALSITWTPQFGFPEYHSTNSMKAYNPTGQVMCTNVAITANSTYYSQIVITNNGTLKIDTQQGDLDTVIELYTPQGIRICNDDYPPETNGQSTIQTNVQGSVTAPSRYPFRIGVKAGSIPPMDTSHPIIVNVYLH